MKIKVRRKLAKSALTKTGIAAFDYCLNPYTGCGHACRYCYVNLMKRFFGHARDEWGSFIDFKANVADVLKREVSKKKPGHVYLSSVTDPYQPLEKEMQLTRGCLEILLEAGWPVTIQTKSSLILRDIDLLERFDEIEAGITVTTDQDSIRRMFEPYSSSIPARIRALEKMKAKGIPTYAFVGPILPMNPEGLAKRLKQAVDEVLIDKMNYPRLIQAFLAKQGLEYILEDEFHGYVKQVFDEMFGPNKICVVY
jgi:DNA repair photolyase